MKRSLIIQVVVATTHVMLASVANAATLYSVTDLGTLPDGGASRPYGINDSAQVVGARFHEHRPG